MKRATYTVREAALKLGVSQYTIRREITEGRLDTVPFGGRVLRIPARAIDELLASAGRA